jgi:hypothetical protein
MIELQTRLSSGWRTYEVLQKNSDGEYSITRVSDALAISGKASKQPIARMQMLQDIGWPEAKVAMKDSQGKCLIARKDEVIWLLKCKPSCWRLYFYVWENEKNKRIIYLHAVCKKTTKEDPKDARQARRIHDEIRPGGSAITSFEFPLG